MGKKVYMFMETERGKIEIPFLSLKLVDLYTVEYKDRHDFLDRLIINLDLPLDKSEVGAMYLGYEDLGDLYEGYDKYMPIKYRKNNYSKDAVVSGFAKYLRKNQDKLDDSSRITKGINIVGRSFNDNFYIAGASDSDLKLVIKKYLGDDYKRYRDTYFMISEDVRITREWVDINRDMENIPLGEMESKNDDYLGNLIEMFSRSDEMAEYAREEISRFDLEEIKSGVNIREGSFVDGLRVERMMVNRNELNSLEECTGLSASQVRELIVNSLKSGRSR